MFKAFVSYDHVCELESHLVYRLFVELLEKEIYSLLLIRVREINESQILLFRAIMWAIESS